MKGYFNKNIGKTNIVQTSRKWLEIFKKNNKISKNVYLKVIF